MYETQDMINSLDDCIVNRLKSMCKYTSLNHDDLINQYYSRLNNILTCYPEYLNNRKSRAMVNAFKGTERYYKVIK